MRNGNSPRLVAIAGSAVLTMVESSVCMKKPVATSPSITGSERAEGSAVWAAGAAERGTGGGVEVRRGGGRGGRGTARPQKFAAAVFSKRPPAGASGRLKGGAERIAHGPAQPIQVLAVRAALQHRPRGRFGKAQTADACQH